jgi:glycosyltransferase involved in cell wall biosynthesis
VIDAIAFRTPVITGDSSGVRDFFNGADDIFITDNKPEILANTILQVAQMPHAQIQNRVKNAYTIYRTTFSPTAFGQRMDEYVFSSV